MLLMQSGDKGRIWSTVSVIGSNDYDMDEGTISYLPDGGLGFFCRPTSAWFQSYDDGRTWVKPAPGRGFKGDPKSYYPSACVLEDGSIFMVGQREGFRNRFGPHGAEVTSVRFRIKKSGEGEGVELLPIGGPS